MLISFPAPYPDELWYGACARWADRNRIDTAAQGARLLCGTDTATIATDLPSRLARGSTALPPGSGLTADAIIDRHTLFPYYAPFLSVEQAARLRARLVGEPGKGLRALAGITGVVVVPAWLRYCPACAASDRCEYGEAYWHRLHQIPGLVACPLHKEAVAVCDSDVPTDPKRRTGALIPAERAVPRESGQAKSGLAGNIDRMLALARDAAWLLEHRPSSPGLAALHERHLALLRAAGLASPDGAVFGAALRQAFVSFHGDDTLKTFGCAIDERKANPWLFRIVHASNLRGNHPLQHLLHLQFVACRVERFFLTPPAYHPFGTGPWPCLNPECRQYRLPHIPHFDIARNSDLTRTLGLFTCPTCLFNYRRRGPDTCEEDRFRADGVVCSEPLWDETLRALLPDAAVGPQESAWQLRLFPDERNHQSACLPFRRSAPRYGRRRASTLEADRRPWLALCAAMPTAGVTELRAQDKSLFERLNKYHRTWLVGLKPPRVASRERTATSPQGEHDAVLAERIGVYAEHELHSDKRPLWLTRNRIAIALDADYLRLPAKRVRWPLAHASLDRYVESATDVALRRIRWATAQYRRTGERPARREFVIRAGCRGDRSKSDPAIQRAIAVALQELHAVANEECTGQDDKPHECIPGSGSATS